MLKPYRIARNDEVRPRRPRYLKYPKIGENCIKQQKLLLNGLYVLYG